MNNNQNRGNPGIMAAAFAGYIGLSCGAIAIKLFCHLFWLYMSLSVLAFFKYIPNQADYM
jgi:hypothetical protein